MLNTDQLEEFLGKYTPISEGAIHGRLAIMDAIGQLVYSSNGQVIVVYLLSADPYSSPQKTGISQAKTTDKLARQLDREFGLGQRGVDAKYAYFCLVPAISIAEAELIIQWLASKYPVFRSHKLE